MNDPHVIWHDVECGAYRADLDLWQRLASKHGDPVLDVGAGTGRVTLELARAGYAVTALDRDARLLEELARRARRLPVTTVAADARDFKLDRRFPVIIVPMQTIQLLGGARGRSRFLRRARAHLCSGGLVAVALTEEFELYRPDTGDPALPADVCRVNGTIYSSRPTAVRRDGNLIVLERRREVSAAAGQPLLSDDTVHIDIVSAEALEIEAERCGLTLVGRAKVPATADHVGSVVVMLGA